MIKFEDVANFYIGCDCKTTDGIGKLIGIVKDKFFIDYRGHINEGYKDELGDQYDFVFLSNEYPISGLKPLLRNCFSITEQEMKLISFRDFEQLQDWLDANKNHLWHDDLIWFIKNGFDVFDLIPNGEAIDKNSITP